VAARLRAFVGNECGLFDSLRPTTPADREAIHRFYRGRGVDPRASALASAHRAVCFRPAIVRGRRAPVATEGLDLHDPGVAEALALLEGLERLFVLDYCDPGRVVEARFTDVARDALDPRQLPLYADEQYDAPGFPYRRFDPDHVMPWLWAMDVARGEPRLVPRDAVYAARSRPRLCQATSNGAACHSSLHHAIVNGIYETVERDALMTAWLARLSPPRLEVAARTTIGDELARLSLRCDYADLTTDLAIPVALAVLRDAADEDLFLVDMVASLAPDRLLAKLQRELAQFTYPHMIDPSHYRTAITSCLEPDRVATFPDHLAFYQRRDKQALADFLVSSPLARRFGEGDFHPPFADVRAEIDELVRRLGRCGYDVLVVDCTPPLLERLGLWAVKVLIPGLQPLNAGHRARVLGGRRVLELPRRLGTASEDLTITQLNPWPHPFW
jgi:ribosomal protein S12 methylthiotransferase accessory factor